MNSHQPCNKVSGTHEYRVGLKQWKHNIRSCSFTLIFAYSLPKFNCESEGSRNQHFITARHTEDSSDYLLMAKFWLSAATVLQKLFWHLSTYIAASHGCWLESFRC